MNLTKSSLDFERKKVLEKYNMIYELNLEDYIDREKSGRFFIHPVEGYVEFLYQPVYTVLPEDYRLVYGDVKIDSKLVELFPTICEGFGDQKKRGRVLVDHPITNREYDYINIVFERTIDSKFIIALFGEATYNIDLKFIKDKSYLSEYWLPENEVVSIAFEGELVKLYKSIGNSYIKGSLKQAQCQSDYVECLMNINRGYIRINNSISIASELITCSGKTYMSYGYGACDNACTKARIKEISFCKERGSIYINTDKIEPGRYKFICFCSGNPSFEYFDPIQGRWTGCIQGGSLLTDIVKNIRISMNRGEKIHNVYLVKDQE